MQCFLSDEQSTLDAGAAIGVLIQNLRLDQSTGFQIWLVGELGAGKTTLVRGALHGLGFTGRVKSPTYPLVETYQSGPISVAHFDLYRLESESAFTEAGFDEMFAESGVRFVEWPDRAMQRLPVPDWCLSLQVSPHGGRRMEIEARTPWGAQALDCLAI